MADTYKFYMERAEAAASAAGTAELANVRERELRAEKTWRGLADRAESVALQREKAESQKAAQRALEREEEQEEGQQAPL